MEGHLLVFYAEWLHVTPRLKELLAQSGLKHELVDIGKIDNLQKVLSFQVEIVPCLVLLRQGKVAGQAVLTQEKEIFPYLGWCRQLLENRLPVLRPRLHQCPSRHGLSLAMRLPAEYPNSTGYQCDLCKTVKRIDPRGILRCPECQFDICPECGIDYA
jgi:hypothetical protein